MGLHPGSILRFMGDWLSDSVELARAPRAHRPDISFVKAESPEVKAYINGHKKTSDVSLVFAFYCAEENPLTIKMLSLEYWLYESQDPIC